MNYSITKILILFFTFLLLSACNNTEKDKSELDFVRFDRLLMELDTNDIQQSFTNLEKQYPEFTTIYFSEVLPVPGYAVRNDTFFSSLKGFISDEKINDIYNLVKKEYPDFREELAGLQNALTNAKKWYPEMIDPRIYTFISEFGYQRFLFEDHNRDGLAIGLDLFLGDAFDYALLESPTNAFSQYLTRTYDKEHLVKKTMESWLEDKMGIVKGDRLIDHMIYNGAKLYLLEDLLEAPDTVLLEYTQEQLDWVKSNEQEMWSFYFQNDWFYTTDQYIIKRLVNPAPNSMALKMPSSAPGRTGNYLGYRIVKSYLRRFPETSVEELLSTDAQKILEASKFKPGY
jgi:hypothetical protein